MKCPKCQQSDEIVTRADSPYCLRCGEVLPPTPCFPSFETPESDLLERTTMNPADWMALSRKLEYERDEGRRDLRALMEEYADRRAQWGDEYLWHKHEDAELIEDINRRIFSEDAQTGTTAYSDRHVHPRYTPGTYVWLMCNNRPTQGIVYVASVMPEFGAMGDLVWTYEVWPSDTLYRVNRERCETVREQDLHSSKEALLESL
jgi:hypothetical protein